MKYFKQLIKTFDVLAPAYEMKFDRKGSLGHKSITGSLYSVLYMLVCLFLVL